MGTSQVLLYRMLMRMMVEMEREREREKVVPTLLSGSMYLTKKCYYND